MEVRNNCYKSTSQVQYQWTFPRYAHVNCGQSSNDVIPTVGKIMDLCPHIGYQETADLVKEAITSSRSIRDLILEKGILDEEQ